jgi:HNH endonuclease
MRAKRLPAMNNSRNELFAQALFQSSLKRTRKKKSWHSNRRFRSYKNYLHSASWARLRSQALQKHKSCQLCGSKDRLQVHHIFYRRHWADTQPSDLVVVCRLCHLKIETSTLQARRQKKTRHIVPQSHFRLDNASPQLVSETESSVVEVSDESPPHCQQPSC